MLFTGPIGVGKRTCAIKMAQAANCEAESARPCGKCRPCRTIALLRHPDIKLIVPLPPKRKKSPTETKAEDETANVLQVAVEESQNYLLGKPQPNLDPKRKISIELVRWVRKEMAKPPIMAPHRFFIFLHAHQMTPQAANALLKTLEEPQKQTTFILTTDKPNELFDTIRSRCRLVKFSAIPAGTIQDWLVEKTDTKKEEAVLAAQISNGSPGTALRFLKDPDEFLSAPVKKFFSLPKADTKAILSTMKELQRTPLATVVSTLFFLYHQTLMTKHGLETEYARGEPAIGRKAELCGTDYLRRVMKYLSGRLEDCRMYLNRRLFLYTLLSSLRKPIK